MPVYIGSTSDECERSGLYVAVSECCQDQPEIALSETEEFPPCRNCEEAVDWVSTRLTRVRTKKQLMQDRIRYIKELQRQEEKRRQERRRRGTRYPSRR